MFYDLIFENDIENLDILPMDVKEYQHSLTWSYIFFFYFQNLSKQVMSEVKILKALKHVSLLLKKRLLKHIRP